MQQMRVLLDITGVFLPPRVKSGNELGDGRRREEDRIAGRSRPLIEKVEPNQCVKILRPGVDSFDIAAASLVGNVIDFGTRAAEERNFIEAQFVAHVKRAGPDLQMIAEIAVDTAFEQHELVALMRVGVERDPRRDRETRKAHVGAVVTREAVQCGVLVEMVIEASQLWNVRNHQNHHSILFFNGLLLILLTQVSQNVQAHGVLAQSCLIRG